MNILRRRRLDRTTSSTVGGAASSKGYPANAHGKDHARWAVETSHNPWAMIDCGGYEFLGWAIQWLASLWSSRLDEGIDGAVAAQSLAVS